MLLAWAAPSALYLLGLAVASKCRAPVNGLPSSRPETKVVIPAFNEETVIADCLEAVSEFDRGSWSPDVLVIADNCTDRTAEIARESGAAVLERTDLLARGKGEALRWAFQQPEVLVGTELVFLLDADTLPEPGALDAAIARTADGDADIVQVALVSRGSQRDNRSALNWWTTTLMGRVRARGLNALGLPSRLQGAGMAISAHVLREVGWPTSGISEDFFATEAFLDQGRTLLFTDSAIVWARAAETDAAARSQRLRWESGKLLSIQRLPVIVRNAFRTRSVEHLALALHVSIPPTSVHAILILVSGLLSLVGGRRARGTTVLAGISALALVFYLSEGLRLMGDSEMAMRAVLAGPRFVRWKMSVQISAFRQYRKLGWERTSREGMS
jgi:cellulose synthase/poly-beta-1,6-N-acetylglucosamine synthase-like glycosyltransferase